MDPSDTRNNWTVTTDTDPYCRSLRAAEEAVAHEVTSVLSDIRSGEIGEGIWHPNGFATFQRYFEPGLGLVRLHVWPQNVRRAVPRHPEIHSHAFNVYSRVLVGTYIENLYAVSPMLRESAGPSVYEVDVLGPDKPDLLFDTGATADLTLVDTRTVPEGSWHDVAAGAFHSTVIPDGALCATLCVLGEHQDGVVTRLVGLTGFDVAPRSRPHLTARERDLVLQQLRPLADAALT